MSKRTTFFLIAAAVCVVLIPATQSAFRWVPFALAAVYCALALLSALDGIGPRRRR